ncbi:MAG: tRNA sulfurtransferase [Candidatus Aminicenantes bacterium]|nr:tRNA sulfurtransferase [Candidatus Aminicenantes bacterium]
MSPAAMENPKDPRRGPLLNEGPEGRAIIVRYNEISLKGRNRGRFEQKLRDDLAWFLRRHGHAFSAIEVERGRIYLRGVEGRPDLKMVLGVHSYSPALEIERDLGRLKKETARFFPEIRGRRDFRVSCQRIAKDFLPDSMGIERELGTLIEESTGTPVRLKDPDYEMHVEIGRRRLYLFSEKHPGFGGFPVDSSGKLVSLISGGIDSPVATFLMMKRGVLPLLLHFAVSPGETDKVRRLRERLQEYAAGEEITLTVIPREELFAGRLDDLYGSRFEPYICVICKYRMHKKAAELALSQGALGVISGDNLAQVASQTLKNLYAQRRAASLPVYSPLIACEKSETVALAKRIGTYEISIAPAPGCRLPRDPKTGVDAARLLKVLEETGLE